MRHRIHVVLSAALTLATPVLAQTTPAKEAPPPLAREGDFEGRLCFSGPATSLVASETDSYGTYSVTGTMQSDNKAFDSVSMECIAAYEMRSKVWQHRGYCVFQDASGDRFHGSDNWTSDGYKVVYLGGTGKFKGFSGEATVKTAGGAVKPIRPGTLQGCRQISAKYRLP